MGGSLTFKHTHEVVGHREARILTYCIIQSSRSDQWTSDLSYLWIWRQSIFLERFPCWSRDFQAHQSGIEECAGVGEFLDDAPVQNDGNRGD